MNVDEAEDIFIQLHQGYKAGNNKLLRELTTPELYQSLRAGLKAQGITDASWRDAIMSAVQSEIKGKGHKGKKGK